jgi:membrane protease YdiL (CAAX protease family)
MNVPAPVDAGLPRRRALLALALLLPAPTMGTWAGLWLWPGTLPGQALFLLTKLWILILPLAWHHWVDRQPVSWSAPRHGGFGMAALTGTAIACLILGSYAVLGPTDWLDAERIVERASRTGLDRPGAYLAGAVYWVTLNSLMEEYVWRWFVFRKLELLTGGGLAVVGASLGFTAHHVVALAAHFHWPLVVLGSLGVCVGGLTWSWLYARYRSIWPCYVSHALVDLPIFWVGYDLIFRGTG